MEHLLASYLFQNRSCPLPAIGKLLLSTKAATISPGEKRIEAPHNTITLVHGDFTTEGLVQYISEVQKIERSQAESKLLRFCNQLQSLDAFAEIKIPHTGEFYVNTEGHLVFKPFPYPSLFLDDVVAEKVIHPASSHSLLVGDRESNTTLMTEYFNVEEQAPRKRWWMAALILALVGMAVISLYYFNGSNAGAFGNATATPHREAPQTYSVPK